MARKQTVGTRHGTGTGWGGPAKGAGSKAPKAKHFEPGNQDGVGANAAKSQARLILNQARDALEGSALKAVMVWINALDDPKQNRMVAAEKILEYVMKKAAVQTEVTVTGSLAERLGAARARTRE